MSKDLEKRYIILKREYKATRKALKEIKKTVEELNHIFNKEEIGVFYEQVVKEENE